MKNKNLYYYLCVYVIIWMILGFVFGIENNLTAGCVIDNYNITTSIFFGLLTTILYLIAIFVNNNKIRTFVINFEFFIWICRFLLYRGGYIMGVSGYLPWYIPLFDFMSIFSRMVIVTGIWSKSNQSVKSIMKIFTIIGLLLLLKMKLFFGIVIS